VESDSRKRERGDLSLLSDMRLHGLLESESFPGYVIVAIGNFADANFPAPTVSVWEESRHPWVSLPPDTPPKRMAKQG
jgi:hypothetical protein